MHIELKRRREKVNTDSGEVYRETISIHIQRQIRNTDRETKNMHRQPNRKRQKKSQEVYREKRGMQTNE